MMESDGDNWHEYSQARRVRGPDALEWLAVAMVILCVIAGAVLFLIHAARVAQASEGHTLTAPIKFEMIVYRAVHGAWPPPDDPVMVKLASQARGRFTRNLFLPADHSVTVQVSFQGRPAAAPLSATGAMPAEGVLSFRPDLLGAAGAQSVVWLCGHAAPPSGPGKVFGADRTTLATNDLPLACREHGP